MYYQFMYTTKFCYFNCIINITC